MTCSNEMRTVPITRCLSMKKYLKYTLCSYNTPKYPVKLMGYSYVWAMVLAFQPLFNHFSNSLQVQLFSFKFLL